MLRENGNFRVSAPREQDRLEFTVGTGRWKGARGREVGRSGCPQKTVEKNSRTT